MKKEFSKKGLILIYPGYQNEAKQYQYGRIIEEFTRLGISIDKLKVDEVIFEIQNSKANLDVNNYDFCIQLVKDKYINKILEKDNIRCFNTYTAIENCDDKMMTYTILENNNIKAPSTISGIMNTGIEKIDNFACSKQLKDYVEKDLGYPFIVKKSNSKGGRDIYKINNRNELEDICNKLNGSEYLFQQFIADNSGKDIRVPVIGGNVVGSFMRINENDFRSNITLGGTAIPYEISNDYKEVAEKVAKILKLDYCSVDFFVSNDKEPIICEVNPDPALKSIEKLLDKNVAKIFAEHIVDNVYHI